MDVKTIILGFLMENSMTGYELKKAFSISFSFFSGISYGSIYPALKKMEREGLITMTHHIQDGSPNRKVYTITDKGKELFRDSLREPISLEPKRDSFLMHLFFFAHLSPEERIMKAGHHLESIRKIQSDLESVGPDIEEHADPYQVLCYQYGLRFCRDLVKNVEVVVRSLEDASGHARGKGKASSLRKGRPK
jgi:DNA-binding PadR family transcriptional regulator